MTKAKKLFSVILIIALLMSMCGCGSGGGTEVEEEVIYEYPSDYSSTQDEANQNSQNGNQNQTQQNGNQNQTQQSGNQSQTQTGTNSSQNQQSGNQTGTNQNGQTNNTTQKGDNTKVKTIKVLAIGNSYSNNTTKYISRIADATEGNTTVMAASLYFPGATLSQHIANIEQWESIFADHTLEETKQIFYSDTVPNSRKYECLTVDGKDIKIRSFYEAIRYADWDYITIQQSPDGCDNFATYEPYLVKLYDYIQAEYKRDDMKGKTCPPILIHQTWAFNNDSCKNYSYEYYPVNYPNNTEMFKKVEETYNRAAQKLKEAKNVNVPLIKSGEAVELAQKQFGYARTASENLADNTLYADYISHLNNRGCYLTACVWIETLAKLSGTTINTSTSSFVTSIDGLSVEECRTLQYIARKVVHGE